MRTLPIILILLSTFLPLTKAQDRSQQFKTSALKNNELLSTEFLDNLSDKDFSGLWTQTENSSVYGYIGDNYQRLRIKLTSVVKETNVLYRVTGKSKVKNNVCAFNGNFTITNIRKTKRISYGVDDMYKGKGITGQYQIIGNYILNEARDQPNGGILKGVFKTAFYLTKDGKIHYDDIQIASDGYSNNQFCGTWTSYTTGKEKTCNWGDYRIPYSESFDIGAGGISPDDKYLAYGWQSLRDFGHEGPKGDAARKEENKQWWK